MSAGRVRAGSPGASRRRRYSDSDSWKRVLHNEPPYPDSTAILPKYTFCYDLNPREPLADKGWKPSPFPIARDKLPPYPVIRTRFLLEPAGRNFSQTRGYLPGRAGNVERELDCYKRYELLGDRTLSTLILYWLIRRYTYLTVSSLVVR